MLQKGNKSLKRTKALYSTSGELKRSGRLQGKRRTKVRVEQDKADVERMWELFEQHWLVKTKQGGRHYCEGCQEPIYGENKSLYHHHCWPKSSFPEHKYKIEGLMIVCWQCHSNIENAYITEEIRDKIEIIKQKALSSKE